MNKTNINPCRLNSAEDLLTILKTTKDGCLQAIDKDYRRYKKFNNNKYRWIEEPNEDLKALQKALLDYLQKMLEPPKYCMAGFKGQNNKKNAEKHRGKREVITMDISHYFSNTQEKYVQKFFKETLGATGETLELLTKLTTYNGYLPTGAATSTLIATFVHKEVFDSIYRKMQSIETDMTVYVDDITLSTHKHIGNWVIKYIKNALKTHGLYLNKSKIKRFGYKQAVVTGVYIAQSGKMSAKFKTGHSVIQTLKEHDIATIPENEVKGLIAKIGYLQQFTPVTMAVTKSRLIKQLKKLKTKDSTKTSA